MWGDATRLSVVAGGGLVLALGPVLAQSTPQDGSRSFELPAFIGAQSLKELEEARSVRQGGARAREEGESGARQVVDEAELKRRAEEERRAAAEAEVKRKAEEVRRLSQKEADARRRVTDERRLVEEENEAKKRADARFRTLATTPAAPPAAAPLTPHVTPNAAPPAPAAAVKPAGEAGPIAAAITLPRAAAGAGKICAAPDVTTQAMSGGRMRIAVASPCRAGQVATIAYGPYKLERRIDNTGHAAIVLDLFLGSGAPVAAQFQDGSRRALAVETRDLERVSKVAVRWSAPVNLDLHAFEYTATSSDSGHVWSGATPSAEDVIAAVAKTGRGQGFISTSSDAATIGDHIEVYTFWHGSPEHRGVVTMALDYQTRGDTPGGEACGAGRLASIEVTVMRLARGAAAATTEQRLLASQPCGVALAREVRFNPDSMPHLTVR